MAKDDGIPDFPTLGSVWLESQSQDAFMDIMVALNRLRDRDAPAAGGGSGGRTVVVVQGGGGGSNTTTTNTVEKASVIEDCTPATGVALNAAVFVDANKTAYLAVATDQTRPCTGIVVKVKNTGNGTKVDVQAPSGNCKALVTDMIANEGQLYLSTTAGRLTNNYNQSGKVINQLCGNLVGYATVLNQVSDSLGNVSLSVQSASASGSFGE